MKENVDKILNSKFGKIADGYFNSVYYILTLTVVCIISHGFDLIMYFAPVLAVLLTLSLIFCRNSFVLMPFFLMCSFSLSQATSIRAGYFAGAAKISILCVLLVVILAGLAFHLVYYNKWKLLFKKAYLTASLALVSGALLVGGLGADTFTPGGVGLAASIGACMFFPYSILVNCGIYEKEKTMRYFMCTVIACVIVVGCAVFQQYIINDFSLENPKRFLLLGYAVSNSAAAYMVIALPLTFYFVYRYKYGFLAMILVALELLVILFTYSRASIVVAVPGVVIVATALCFVKKQGRLPYLITYAVAVAVAIVGLVLVWDKIYAVIEGIIRNGISSSGRIELWEEGFTEWRHKPVFGLGLWFLRAQGNGYWSFHCEPLTYLFCCGIVGIGALIYHRYKLVRLTFSSPLNAERVFTALAVLAMLLNALLDTAMTSQAHLLYYSVMLVMIELDAKHVAAPVGAPVKSANDGDPDGSAAAASADITEQKEKTLS